MRLLPFLFLLSFACYGQIKIGDITISDSLAKEYFLDCHKKPVVKYYSRCFTTGVIIGGLPTWEEIDKKEYVEIKNAKQPFALNTYCEVKVESNPRTPSASDFAAFMRRKYKTP